MRPDAITIWVPAWVAILPASILVCMPPRDSSEPAAPAIASIAGVMRSTSGTSLASGIVGRRRVVESVDVGEQHEQVRARHGGDARGQPVVVAVADFVGGDRVVLVDHGHCAPFQQLVDGGARIEIAPALLGVLQRDQHLPGGDAVTAEHLRPGARERDLADGGRGLAVLELERARRQLEHGAAERDGAGRDHEDVALLAVQTGDVLGQRR